MEVFIFVRIKGDSTQLTSLFSIKMLRDDDNFMVEISRFEATKAKCRHDRDCQKLLAVIEASFGTTTLFDQLVFKIFKEQVLGSDLKSHRSARAVSASRATPTAQKAGAEVLVLDDALVV